MALWMIRFGTTAERIGESYGCDLPTEVSIHCFQVTSSSSDVPAKNGAHKKPAQISLQFCQLRPKFQPANPDILYHTARLSLVYKDLHPFYLWHNRAIL